MEGNENGAMAAINAWLDASEMMPATSPDPIVSARPPAPNISSNQSGLSGAESAATFSRAQEHLRAIRRELRALERKGSVRNGSRISQLKRRAEEIQAHLDVVERAGVARAIFGVATKSTENLRHNETHQFAKPVVDNAVTDAVAIEAATRARIEADASADCFAVDEPVDHDGVENVEPFVRSGDDSQGEYLEASEEAQDLVDKLDIDDVQMQYEHLLFASTRIDSYIAAVHSQVENYLNTKSEGTTLMRSIKKECAKLGYLITAKNALLVHAVRVVEVAGSVLALNALEASRLQALAFDVGELRGSIRVFLFVRRRFAEFIRNANEALSRMDIKPTLHFVGILTNEAIKSDIGFSPLKRRISNQCEIANAELRTAAQLVISLLRVESASEEHFHAMLFTEKVTNALILLQASKTHLVPPDWESLIRAVDSAKQVVSHGEQELNNVITRLRTDATGSAGGSNRECIAKTVAHEQLELARERQTVLKNRDALLTAVRRKIAVAPPGGISCIRIVDDVLTSLTSSVLGCCNGNPTVEEVRIQDETVEIFKYASERVEQDAISKSLLVSDIPHVIGNSGEAPCEVVAALKLVFGSGDYGKGSIDAARPNLEKQVSLESVRLRRNRSVLCSISGSRRRNRPPPPSSPPPSATAPPSTTTTPPPATASAPGTLAPIGTPPRHATSSPQASIPRSTNALQPGTASPPGTVPPPSNAAPPSVAGPHSHSSEPDSRQTLICYMCLNQAAQKASSVTPCCNTPLCSECGPSLIRLFGSCPKCSRILRESQLRPLP